MDKKYCVTLDQAKRLKELGFEAEYSCVWFKEFSSDKSWLGYDGECPANCYENYPAYHVGELLELLPNEIDDGTGNYFLTKTGQVRGYLSPDRRWLVQIGGTRPEAGAFGDILIYLLETNLI